ncbi:hemicentin-2-like [Tropilaelaps mercedesae]|uniref:Hemicentin-2-like n=1 Tax=Tropilaelaps mercedesae TaxID=418985 RepID=A0A1V9XV47_9ACAR|nr:hemicentin-2-like [Tropilaelaps mercedesae]
MPAGPPEPVHNCTTVNQTEDSVTVACHEGYDGGMEQTFHMEVHDAEQPYVVAIWASNARGQSPPTMLIAHTIPSPISLTRRGE